MNILFLYVDFFVSNIENLKNLNFVKNSIIFLFMNNLKKYPGNILKQERFLRNYYI